MSEPAELVADLLERVAAVTPDDQIVSVLSSLIGAAAGMMTLQIGKDETVGTLARLCIAIDAGDLPGPPRPN
jgi:hypothetical protein